MSEPSLWSLESVRVQERGRILGILESALQQIVSGADDLFRDPPKPGRHVIGGPVPKPGERTEAEADREAWRELRAALKAEQAAHAETKAEVERLRPTPDEEAAAEAVMADPHNLMGCYTQADMDAALAEAQATARRDAIEEAAQAIETVGGGSQSDRMIARFCADRVRALAPVAQKGGEDAR